jgi:hypothetical protein
MATTPRHHFRLSSTGALLAALSSSAPGQRLPDSDRAIETEVHSHWLTPPTSTTINLHNDQQDKGQTAWLDK